jgi:GAF domain/ANTAR domain
MAREDLLARTFVDLAGLGVGVVDPEKVSQLLARRCVELFDTSAAGILLAGADGQLGVWGSSSGGMRTAELFELQAGQGPCLECYRTGTAIVEPDLAGSRRWRRFAPVALAAGFASVHAVPLRTGGRIIGALNLFRARTGRLGAADMLAAEALAQATAITILRQAASDEGPVGGSRLASDNQIIEQAKGVLAGRAVVSVDEAYGRIRRYANYHRLPMVDVCQEVVDGTLSLTTFQETSLQRHRHVVGADLRARNSPPAAKADHRSRPESSGLADCKELESAIEATTVTSDDSTVVGVRARDLG